jgi:ribonuclease-3
VFTDITDRIRLLFRKDKESYLRFYRILGFYPRNIAVYEQALLHKSSSVKTDKGRLINNERLEFLGDAVLDAVVADIVYRKFEGKREGFLTNTRSKIVQRETLNRIAGEIGLDKLVKFTSRQPSHNSYMGGNAFEALVGAIYLDRGYEACKEFMERRIIGAYIDVDKISRKEVNFKSKLIEWCQKNRLDVAFALISQEADKTAGGPTFVSEVRIEGVAGGRGKGFSKKESQQLAARETLDKVKKDKKFLDLIFATKAKKEAEREAAAEPAPRTDAPTTEAVRSEMGDTRLEDDVVNKAFEEAFKE